MKWLDGQVNCFKCFTTTWSTKTQSSIMWSYLTLRIYRSIFPEHWRFDALVPTDISSCFYNLSYALLEERTYKAACGLTYLSRICQAPYFTFTTSVQAAAVWTNITLTHPKLTSIFLSSQSPPNLTIKPWACAKSVCIYVCISVGHPVWMVGEY